MTLTKEAFHAVERRLRELSPTSVLSDADVVTLVETTGADALYVKSIENYFRVMTPESRRGLDEYGVVTDSIAKRCLFAAHNMTSKMLEDFKLPKCHTSEHFKINSIYAAVDSVTTLGVCYVALDSKAHTKNIADAFQSMGAIGCMVKTFEHGLADEDATDAIAMVINTAANSSTPLYSRYRDEDGGITEPLFAIATEKCNAMQDQKKKQAAADDCRMTLDNTVAIKGSLFDVAGKVDAQSAISDEIKNDVGDVKAVANETKDIVKQTSEAVDKLNALQRENDDAKKTIAYKTLQCDRQEQKTAKATQRINECEKNMTTAQNMARIDRDSRRETEAKLAESERMTALYAELHDVNACRFAERVHWGQQFSTEERHIAAYGALLLVKNTIIAAQKNAAVEADAASTAMANAMAAKDVEIARLKEELAAFSGGAMET